jgi:hypothetical protein
MGGAKHFFKGPALNKTFSRGIFSGYVSIDY